MSSFPSLSSFFFNSPFHWHSQVDVTVASTSTSESFSEVPPWNTPNWWRKYLSTFLVNMELRPPYTMWNMNMSITNKRQREKKLSSSKWFLLENSPVPINCAVIVQESFGRKKKPIKKPHLNEQHILHAARQIYRTTYLDTKKIYILVLCSVIE